MGYVGVFRKGELFFFVFLAPLTIICYGTLLRRPP